MYWPFISVCKWNFLMGIGKTVEFFALNTNVPEMQCWQQRILQQDKKVTSSGAQPDNHIKSLMLIHLS